MSTPAVVTPAVVTPAVVIAAPGSGSGKTTVATGLLGALRAAGHRPAPFKVGPDYVDPGYHALAAGRPGRNLDPVLVGQERVPALFAHGCAGADVAVVEGVMGLFDGKVGGGPSGPGHGSTAHVAALLGAPVVLVVDSRGQSRSLAALLHGFATFDAGVHLAGVVLNKVGSARHEEVLREACATAGVPVLGALPRHQALAVPSRHLGLVTAAEHGGEATAAVAAMTALVARHVDLDAVLAVAATARPVTAPAWDPAAEVGAAGAVDRPGPRPVVAVAGGPAFTFGYPEHAELLAAAGADVVTVDPLADTALPPGTAALVLPGGFPEEHVAELAGNTALLAAVRDLAATGAPVHAECGGLLYLCRRLAGRDGPSFDLAGVLDAEAVFSPRLLLGYREAVALGGSVLHRAGERVSGHEFHRTVVAPVSGPSPAWGWRAHSGGTVTEGFLGGAGAPGVHASYLHTHPAGTPHAVARLVAAARTAPLPA
ncbi:cobyrinate a,c-diamide synthase [Rhodococcus aerolatus]